MLPSTNLKEQKKDIVKCSHGDYGYLHTNHAQRWAVDGTDAASADRR
jgi:hypothetical protein